MDSAWDKDAQQKVYGEDLWALDEVNPSGYECWGCGIPLFPASYSKENIQRPHFRLYQKTFHRIPCDAEVEETIIVEGKKKSVREHLEKVPGLSPSRLTLVEKRTLSNDGIASSEEDVRTGYNSHRGQKNDGKEKIATSRRPAQTLRPICKAFINFPFDRNMSLKIPGVSGETYSTAFKKLPGNKLDTYEENKVFYSKLSWEKFLINDDELVLKLSPYDWKESQPIGHYHLKIDWSSWAKRTRTLISNELEASRKEAIDAKKSGKKDEAWVFFLGQQDTSHPELFHLSDHRLVCVLVGEIQYRFR